MADKTPKLADKKEQAPKVVAKKPDDEEEITNWADKMDSDVYEAAEKVYEDIVKAYENRRDADQAIEEYWHIYNAEPDDNQTYQGNSKCYIPACRDAINARTKRALRQLFPTKYNHVDAIGTDGVKPVAQLALLEHYVRQSHLKSVVRSMLIAGDVTGQWNLYIDWRKETHNVISTIRKNPIVKNMQDEDLEAVDSSEEVDALEDEEVVVEGPEITDFATEDMVVIPPTCNDIQKCDVSCIKLRMSKAAVMSMVDAGVFLLPADSEIGAWVDEHKGAEKVNPQKKRTDDAGIKTEGTFKYALIFEAHMMLEFVEGKKSLGYVYFSGEKELIGIIRAPQWGQKRPILSAPVERIGGSFNGISKVEAVKFMQWNITDFWNMGQDSAMYSLLPIIMTDPEKNPNYAMMVFGLAAVWPVDPNSTKFQNFPQLWKDSVQMCQALKAQIQESLEVNDMMMAAAPKGRKNNQAVGAQAQESSVAVIDHAERFEEEILNPLMERFFEYDMQFRDEELTVITHGEIGVRAAMEKIPVQQWGGERYFFQWSGTDFVMNMQRMQQQIATMNVLRGIPPQQLNGRKLDIAPILEILVQNVFGAELGSRILIDDRNKFTIAPEIEDEMMVNGIEVEPHEWDNDEQHLQIHQQSAQTTGDPTGLFRNHMQKHVQQMMAKRQKEMAAQQPHGQPGVPGGAGPGVAGAPRPGAQPMPPKPGQQPPGRIGPDQIAGGDGS